jgi:hypothetical protein
MQQNYAKIGGILSVVAGGIGCLGAVLVIFMAVLFGVLSRDAYYYDEPESFLMVMMVVYIVCGIIGLVVSALAVIGGINGIKRKNWGLALAGGIAGVLAFFPCGVVAVIFTAMGKPEFDAQPAPTALTL